MKALGESRLSLRNPCPFLSDYYDASPIWRISGVTGSKSVLFTTCCSQLDLLEHINGRTCVDI